MKIEDFQDIIYEKEENGICTITFNRPERKNAFSFITFLEIATVLDDMEADKNARVLIMTGCKEARAFSSGGYFNMKMLTSIPEELKKEIDFLDIAQKKICLKFWDFSKPVIAAINGLAVGAGITMPLACADLIYMADDPDTWLGFYFVKRAIVPEFGTSFVLPFYLGFQKAKEILYFGDKIHAKEAEKLGLINRALPPEELIPHAREQALKLIPPKGPSVALKLMKKTMHDYFRQIISQTLDKENEALRAAFKTHDMRESTRALQEKREPKFKGK
ncbi:MAG: enoyl-CoA hydratase/isomerase family protein [Promethearchaeota archaeon]